MPPQADQGPRTGWLRGALLVAFAGGLAGGWVAHVSFSGGFAASLWVLGGASLALLLVANFLISQSLERPSQRIPLPGDIYGDRKRPDPKDLEMPSLKGRIPFQAGKGVAQRNIHPEMVKLYDRLDALNLQLQRANVKLGLGELSNEGYQRVVTEIKERRAEVEHLITQQEMVWADKP